MTNAGELHALLLTREESVATSFGSICRELGIVTQPGAGCRELGQQLEQEKFQAVVMDFDSLESGQEDLAKVRESHLNKHAVVVAIATSTRNIELALYGRAHFVLKRPIEEAEIRRTMRAAYDFMLLDRRRHFRCSAVLPVRLRLVRNGSTVECTSMNLSANGIAVYSQTSFKPAEAVDLEIVLPDAFVIHASAIVVWDDKHGKTGLHFQCRTPEMRAKLDAWLSQEFALLLRAQSTSLAVQ